MNCVCASGNFVFRIWCAGQLTVQKIGVGQLGAAYNFPFSHHSNQI